MTKYIDADRLNADLDKWVEAMADAEGDYSEGVRFAIQHFIFLLASLQQEQPEVDLDEETLAKEFHTIQDKCFNQGIEGWQREKLIARHFYELGLNSK